MLKRVGLYFFIAALLLVVTFFLNDFVLSKADLTTSYSLISVYLFNALASIVVYVLLEFTFNSVPNQVGFAYLTLVFVKLGLFLIVFNVPIFSEEGLEKFERVSLIIPVFIFLILEALASFKLLSQE